MIWSGIWVQLSRLSFFFFWAKYVYLSVCWNGLFILIIWSRAGGHEKGREVDKDVRGHVRWKIKKK